MPAFHIVVLNKLKQEHRDMIEAAAPGSTIVSCDLEEAGVHMDKADILLAWGFNDIRPLFLSASRLHWVHSLSAGVENITCPELKNSSIILTNSKGIHGIPVSEHVLALVLSFTRGINYFVRYQQKKQWKRATVDEIYDKTIGIIGLGSIGREIAKKAKALGMNVIAFDPFITDAKVFEADGVKKVDSIEELYAQADYLSLHIPATEQTKKSIGHKLMTSMPKGATLVNTARKEVIDEAGVIQAMTEREDLKYITDIAPEAAAEMHLEAELGLTVRAGQDLALQTDVGGLDPGAGVRAAVDVQADRPIQGYVGQPLLESVDHGCCRALGLDEGELAVLDTGAGQGGSPEWARIGPQPQLLE